MQCFTQMTGCTCNPGDKKFMEKDEDKLKREAVFKKNLFARGKADYVQGNKPDVECIMCAIRDHDPDVKACILYQDKDLFIIPNIYPYNPGHLMIVPADHVERMRDLSKELTQKITGFIKQAQDVLEEQFGCTSFNIGINEGPHSGQSIKHLHVHLVPRFKSELGFLDVIGNTRAVIYTIDDIYRMLEGKFT
ncbi:HIT domain-containing protein [Candidatus Bathyarchaeota archaeon]|nr:HIT domain-containing protein [Candidatus Bathyarchaeota archaeon]